MDGVDLITVLRNCLSALCTFEIERGPNSTACKQSESSLATLLSKLRLYFFPAVEFAGVRKKNCPSVYFESSPAHRVPLSNLLPGAAAVGEMMSMSRATLRKKCGECSKSARQLNGSFFVW
jgi:hypothetical protein